MVSSTDDWTPGVIAPPPRSASIPVSIRMPQDLYEELGRYAKRVGARRSYLILECLRRLLAAKKVKAPGAPRGAAARGKKSPRRSRP